MRKDSESKPGDRIATDQIVSAQPGLVPQGKGTPTRARISEATVFVDCAKNWVKIQLMKNVSGKSTLEAKNLFQRDYMTCGVTPKRYHADNGRYAENMFKDDCKAKLQSLTFCRV